MGRALRAILVRLIKSRNRYFTIFVKHTGSFFASAYSTVFIFIVIHHIVNTMIANEQI